METGNKKCKANFQDNKGWDLGTVNSLQMTFNESNKAFFSDKEGENNTVNGKWVLRALSGWLHTEIIIFKFQLWSNKTLLWTRHNIKDVNTHLPRI